MSDPRSAVLPNVITDRATGRRISLLDWQAANRGRRLDHIWVSPPLKDRIKSVEVLTDVRNWLPPSDHAPVLVELS